MRRSFAFVVTDHVELVLAGLIDKIGGFVHVVPNSSHAVVCVCAVQVAPPAPGLGQSVVDENTFAGPDFGNEQLTTPAMLKIILLHPFVENVVALTLRLQFRVCRFTGRGILCWRLILHAGIYNRNQLHALAAQPGGEFFGIRKARGVKREDSISLHVIDVQMDDVQCGR